MTPQTAAPAPFGGYALLRRFSVAEYHHMIASGVFDEDEPVELLEGYVVMKMPRNPPHDATVRIVSKRLDRLLPDGWDTRVQSAITLPDSEPEPDVVIVLGDERTYLTRHPGPAEIGPVVEVADSSLDRDRTDKVRLYARAGLPTYWVVNLPDHQLEVFTDPSGPTPAPGYARRQVLPVGAAVDFVLGGAVVASVPVAELLP